MRDLDLRQRSGGATVIAVVRKEQPLANPSPTLEIETNDTLVPGRQSRLSRCRCGPDQGPRKTSGRMSRCRFGMLLPRRKACDASVQKQDIDVPMLRRNLFKQ